MRVASEVIELICSGIPMPEEVLSASKTEQAESEEATQVLLETSVGDGKCYKHFPRIMKSTEMLNPRRRYWAQSVLGMTWG